MSGQLHRTVSGTVASLFILGGVILSLASLPIGCDSLVVVQGNGTGTEPASLTSPARIAAGGSLISVTDYQAQSVFIFNKSGMQIMYSFPVAGTPLAVGKAGDLLYVGNETNGSVEVYDLFGNWQFDLGGAKGLIQQPRDLAIDAGAGRVFVVDGASRSVKVYSLDGTAQSAIVDAARIVNPTAVALDTTNQLVFISDYGNVNAAFGNPARIHVYTYSATYVRGITGSSGGFSRPQGLAYDNGHLFLVDAVLGQVLVFNSTTGTKLTTLGSFGTDAGQLQLPLDIVVDPPTKDVYVTNNRAARVEVFAGGGILP